MLQEASSDATVSTGYHDDPQDLVERTVQYGKVPPTNGQQYQGNNSCRTPERISAGRAKKQRATLAATLRQGGGPRKLLMRESNLLDKV